MAYTLVTSSHLIIILHISLQHQCHWKWLYYFMCIGVCLCLCSSCVTCSRWCAIFLFISFVLSVSHVTVFIKLYRHVWTNSSLHCHLFEQHTHTYTWNFPISMLQYNLLDLCVLCHTTSNKNPKPCSIRYFQSFAHSLTLSLLLTLPLPPFYIFHLFI